MKIIMSRNKPMCPIEDNKMNKIVPIYQPIIQGNLSHLLILMSFSATLLQFAQLWLYFPTQPIKIC